MVLAYHIVLCTYGFWLPNDPRGSNSRSVRAPHLRPLGPPTLVTDTRSHARDPHDSELRHRAKLSLLNPPTRLTGRQALVVARSFSQTFQAKGGSLLALAVLSQHCHLVVARHADHVETLISLFKSNATRSLRTQNLLPPDQPLWARGHRKVFINSIPHLTKAVDYVRSNPLRDGKPVQNWSFVTPLQDYLDSLRQT